MIRFPLGAFFALCFFLFSGTSAFADSAPNAEKDKPGVGTTVAVALTVALVGEDVVGDEAADRLAQR